MRRILLVVAYEGTNYCGWQVQPNGLTIEEVLNRELSRLFKEDIKVIGIRHGEKMYETLLTNEECAKAIDLGGFYRVPADNRGLNYDKYFKDGDAKRNTLTEFNSNNTKLLNLEETKATIAKLAYIQERLAED